MARRPKQDGIDQLCKEWARTRRQLTGVDDPRTAKEYIGALRSTLGQRRDLHSGSKSNKVEQFWPEVYEGNAKVVNEAFMAMSPWERVIMDTHYVARGNAQDKYEFLCVCKTTYYDTLREVQKFIDVWFRIKEAV
jgi:hypothetical protein